MLETSIEIRSLHRDDVAPLVKITEQTHFFRPEEIKVADEVLNAAVSDSSDYSVYVASQEDAPVGFICFGHTPMTRGTWDIYWIVVDRNYQKYGIGKKLMRLAEEEIQRQEGYLVVVETSSQELYKPTHRFYLSLQYKELIRIPDFYDLGDDKIIFIKTLPGCEKP